MITDTNRFDSAADSTVDISVCTYTPSADEVDYARSRLDEIVMREPDPDHWDSRADTYTLGAVRLDLESDWDPATRIRRALARVVALDEWRHDSTPPMVGEEAGRAIRRALADGYVDPVEHPGD